MSVKDIIPIFVGGGGSIVILMVTLMSIFQIAPIKINPWSSIARSIGKAVNADLLKELSDTRATLEKHIQIDDERNADGHRAKILAFNTELLRGQDHTREDFIEVLYEIDFYERYCREHPEYKNNRAVLAIENIKRVYADRLKKHDFLGEPHSEM